MKIRVMITGRSYHAAESLPDELTLGEGADVQAAVDQISGLLGPDNALPRSCLVAVGNAHLGTIGSFESR